MKGWHCQGRRAAVKVCAESYKAPEGEAPSRSWVQGHPYEGGATGAGNGMKACLPRRWRWRGRQDKLAHQQMPRQRHMENKAVFRNEGDAQEG